MRSRMMTPGTPTSTPILHESASNTRCLLLDESAHPRGVRPRREPRNPPIRDPRRDLLGRRRLISRSGVAASEDAPFVPAELQAAPVRRPCVVPGCFMVVDAHERVPQPRRRRRDARLERRPGFRELALQDSYPDACLTHLGPAYLASCLPWMV